MASKIEIISQFVPGKFRMKLPFNEAYCKEEPLEVLNILGPKLNVSKYKRVYHSWGGMADYDGCLLLYSLHVLTANPPEGLVVEKSIDDIDFSFIKPRGEIPYMVQKDKTVASLVRCHLMDVHTHSIPRMMGVRPFYMVVESVDNYLKTRKKHPDEKKELILQDVVEFASMILQKPVDADYLTNLNISVPKKGAPYMGLF